MQSAESISSGKPSKHETRQQLPPTPPLTDDNVSETSQDSEDVEVPLPPPSKAPTQVLDVDLKTPDAHVPRDPRLIRLTGVHPFNVEAPLTALFDEGFLTSPELFYVRNHGPVPQVADEDIPNWKFTVEGLVDNPITISLTQLITEYEQITCPITLVCAGNRRKEQNMVRKSKGFSWGAAGLSTALWTGVAMSEVIRRARPKRKAKYVCMEGADKLPNGYYGTSVKLNWVMDPNKGMMLSYKMNGEMLRPDHGKPLRAVIPGQIGGRSVKWLKKIILTAEPSDNWYHIYDNRVLPTMVSPEESANNQKWWTDERYAIYDLSPNSAICCPQHNEALPLHHTPNINNTPPTYRAKGYAYSGGGRRITRVELSLDQGKTWRLATISYAEDRYRETSATQSLYGGRIDMSWRESCFCWCFWSIDIPVADLCNSKDLLVRAMDDSMNIQPRDMYWSVLGMMNNPWFRVTITHNTTDNTLRFEHPTQPALQPGGWMERVKKAGGDLANGFWGESSSGEAHPNINTGQPVEPTKEICMTNPDLTNNHISLTDLRAHTDEPSPWFVLNNHVYDGTAFLQGHPGGAQSIISAAGTDCTEEFMAIHSETAKAMMAEYHIGTLDADGVASLAEQGEEGEGVGGEVDPESAVFLREKHWAKVTLVGKKKVSWDTRVFTFKLAGEKQRLGLPVGKHVMLRLRDPVTREAVIRAYTPISEVGREGVVEVLVKLYFGQGEDGMEGGGRMGLALEGLPMGHSVDMKGPVGRFEYLGGGRCSVGGRKRRVGEFVMVCGGSGVTPIYQVFRAVMREKEGGVRCTVFDGNRLEEDVLCREELEGLVAEGEGRGRVVHTLTKAGEEWKGLRGRVTGELVGEYVKWREDALVLVCGPEAMERSMKKDLVEIGWKEEQLVFF